MSPSPSFPRCIGYGEFENVCACLATTRPALLWCQRCEVLRREAITKQVAVITKSFESSRTVGQEDR